MNAGKISLRKQRWTAGAALQKRNFSYPSAQKRGPCQECVMDLLLASIDLGLCLALAAVHEHQPKWRRRCLWNYGQLPTEHHFPRLPLMAELSTRELHCVPWTRNVVLGS